MQHQNGSECHNPIRSFLLQVETLYPTFSSFPSEILNTIAIETFVLSFYTFFSGIFIPKAFGALGAPVQPHTRHPLMIPVRLISIANQFFSWILFDFCSCFFIFFLRWKDDYIIE
jgi:hypothetical protein